MQKSDAMAGALKEVNSIISYSKKALNSAVIRVLFATSSQLRVMINPQEMIRHLRRLKYKNTFCSTDGKILGHGFWKKALGLKRLALLAIAGDIFFLEIDMEAFLIFMRCDQLKIVKNAFWQQ